MNLLERIQKQENILTGKTEKDKFRYCCLDLCKRNKH